MGDPNALSVVPSRKEQQRNDLRPFAFPWLDSAYQETVLHNTPWDKVKKAICDAMAKKIEKQRDEPERMQMIFQLVGPEFKSQYFPDLQYEPFLLQPPNLNREQVEKLRGEATAWLNNQAQRAAKEVGCGRVLPGTTPGNDLSDDQLEFLQNTYEIFLKNQDRYMVQKETIEAKRQHDEALERDRFAKEMAEKNRIEVKYRSASTVSSKPSTALTRAETPLNQRIENMVGGEPVFHCFQTETVALSVKKIMQRDSKRFTDVAQRLHGRQLPVTLRTYMWLDVLFKADRDRLKEGNVEKMVRERFGKAVARGVVDLSLKRPTNSPIAGLIENAVVESYSKTLAMRPYNVNQHLIDASRALNVLYTYDRSYEPYLIHWLFPIQICFKEHTGSIEHVYELAMYLDLVNQNCYPTWPKIFAMADQTLLMLENVDAEFHDHLKEICLKDTKIDPKDFMVYLIHEEREKAQALLNLPPQSSESDRMKRALLADPLIFLRKWIGEGFVSILDTPAVLFIWDQNFLQYWQGKTMENMCLALLELLRYKFMEATDYSGMKQVFLHEPCKLYTADIQRSWVHIERGGNPAEVQYFNRQRPLPRSMSPTRDQTPLSTPLTFSEEGPLPNFGVKNLRLKLVIPSDRFYKEAWLAQFDPENIKLLATLYFSGGKLAYRLTTTAPDVRLSTQAEGKDRVLLVSYTTDILEFDHESLNEKYNVLKDIEPFLAIRVDYLQVSGKVIAPMPIAWATIATHTKDEESSTWKVNARQVECELIPGLMPQCVISVPPKRPTKKPPVSVLAEGSELYAQIFDPAMDKSPVGSPQRIPAQKTPTPIPTPKPETPKGVLKHWVQHDPDVAAEDTSRALALNEPFDLYVDSIRFLPDTATIVKVTGRFLKTGEVTNIPDIEAYPEVNSEPRNPQFNYRQVVNDSRHLLDENALLILRVYTVQKFDRQLVVVGSCLVSCVNKNGKINTGGFQLRLRNGMPDVSNGVASLQPDSMDHITPVPSCSMLIRLLPHEPGYRPMPDYTSSYYVSDQCAPNQSENTIFNSFYNDQTHPSRFTTVIDKIKREESDESETTDLHVVPYITERTDPKRYLPPQTPAGNLDLLQAVRYRIETGFRVQIQAFGLPEGLWCQCLLRVIRGPRAMNKRHKRPDGFGKDMKSITTRLDYVSAQKAPKWNDNMDFHPYFDNASYLLIELYGLKFQYKPKGDPKILSLSGQPVSETDLTNGWAVVPLFLNETLMTGRHLVPMYKDLPDADVLQRLTEKQPLSEAVKTEKLQKFQSACFVVKLQDLQYPVEEEFPIQPLPEYRDLVGSDSAGYDRTSKDESGKMINDNVLRYLPADIAKAGAHGAAFQREQLLYDQAASEAIVQMMKLKKSLP